ncbi:MAG: fibrobacter succinogenes major paralogous domain-containing protein [Candidatus Saccharibacteria bacterium]|nr:fibrobacter succinogenes major paralogous domain-containing protein [Candidatus Saccharibacteria bacterium]
MSKHLKPFLGILALIFLLSLATSENTSANSTKLSIKIIPVLKTSVSYTPITIEADGNLDISDIDLRVSSNNRTGFRTYMSTTHESSEENATSLAFEDIDKIETLSEDNLAAENFTMNRWGYSIDDGATFSSIHAKDSAPSEVLAATKASDDGNKIIRVGVKANTEKASGRYINTLLFTTIPNYTPTTLEDIIYMQEVTPDICAVTPENIGDDEQYLLEDIRDGKIYWVGKLADGNCWMTQNLDYDLNSSVALTPEDSDVVSNWTPIRSTIQGMESFATDWVDDYETPYSLHPGDMYEQGEYFETSRGCEYPAEACGFSRTMYEENEEHGHIGNYYNWPAAVARNDISDLDTVGTDVNTSICPKGWRLPHGELSNSKNEFQDLVYAYTDALDSDEALFNAPVYMVRAGRAYGKVLDDMGSRGTHWSSTLSSASTFHANSLLINGASIEKTRTSNTDRGFTVRCVARKQTKTLTVKDQADDSVLATYDFETTYKLPEVQKEGYNLLGYTEDPTSTEPTYNVGDTITEPKTLYAIYEEAILIMQNVADWKNKLELEQQVQVKDARDGKIYWVAKLKDGNIWMTQNLDLDLSTTTTLTPADSDVATNWTPSRATITGAANLNTTNWANNNNNPYSFDPGNYYFDGTYYNSATCNYLTTTCDHFATTPYDLNGEHGHVGNYYNWSAAVASNDTSATTVAGTDMSSSICPAGWRLPHGYQSVQGNDFATLNTAYGGATNSDSVLLANPLFFVRGGLVYSGSLSNSADLGYYWSSTAYSATYADGFSFYSGYVYTSDSYSRYYGFSVRCLAR